jgi:hypothetical protein
VAVKAFFRAAGTSVSTWWHFFLSAGSAFTAGSSS